MSAYPTQIDSLQVDLEDRERAKTGDPDLSKPTGAGFHAQLHIHVNEAVMAIEQTLGLEPQGNFADVAARLAAIDTAIAGGDTDLADAVATLTSAIDTKQDASTAATDAELAAAISTINSALALKQDASSAATDSELLSETNARKAADASEVTAREAGDAAEAAARKEAVATEKAAREAADVAEATARKEADSAEKAARESGDSTAMAAAAAAQAIADAALPKSGGTMTGPVTLAGDPSTNLQPATKQFVAAQIAALINGAPGALDTLKELADALGSDESAITALTSVVAGKLGAASNLSDLVDAVAARANLGLGSAAVKDSGALGEANKVLAADDATMAKIAAALGAIPYLTPADSRIVNKIKVSSEGFADSNAGWSELLALAASLGARIIGPVSTTYKFEQSWVLPNNVDMDSFSSKEGTVLNFPKNLGVPTYAWTENIVAVGATTIKVNGVSGGTFAAASPASPQRAFLAVSNQIFTYTGLEVVGETATFTGVAGVTKASGKTSSVIQNCGVYVANGSDNRDSFGPGIKIKGPEAVSKTYAKETPPELMDGVWLGGSRRINCTVAWFRILTTLTQDHQRWGRNFTPESGWCTVGWMGPRESAGNQVFESGIYLNGNVWASFFVSNGNLLSGVDVGAEALVGQGCWVIWKEKYQEGKGGTSTNVISTGVSFHHCQFEALGMGIVGCPDGKGILEDPMFDECYAEIYAGNTPEGQTPPAAFACQVKNIKARKAKGLGIWATGMQAFFLSDEVTGQIDELRSLVEVATTHAAPFVKGKNTEFPSVKLKGETISAYGREGMDAEIKLGHVLHRKHVSQTRVGRYEKPVGVLGVAIADIQNSVVIFATTTPFGSTNERVKVKVHKQSTPPTAVTAEPNATVGTLLAQKYFVKVTAILSGGGEVAASAEASATAVANQSVKIAWAAPVLTVPNGQVITNYRVYVGTATGEEKGYKAVESGSYQGAYSAATSYSANQIVSYEGKAWVAKKTTKGNTPAEGEFWRPVGLELVYSGAALTGSSAPPTTNVGCEIYGSTLVRTNASAEAGVASSASGPGDTNGVTFGYVYEGADNGETAEIFISPALL
jgi:hypothetical protein